MKNKKIFIIVTVLFALSASLYSWQPSSVKKKAEFSICSNTSSSAEASARNQFAEATLSYADCKCVKLRGSSCKKSSEDSFKCKCLER